MIATEDSWQAKCHFHRFDERCNSRKVSDCSGLSLMPSSITPRLLTIKQAAAYCACSVWAIRQVILVEGVASLHDWPSAADRPWRFGQVY